MSEGLSIAAIVLSFLSFIAAICALGISLGIKWSSHQIEWRPLEVNDPFKPYKDDEEKETSEEEILNEAYKLAEEGKQRKKKKEEDPLEFLETSNF